ncbi:thiamine phosphate synthase [Jatrophihabitans sp.]|uniref:thiamine phosphate synthase n=1 Tax=Jatrophihabitans sp. TaxID=1932789 RepID=UPI0030C747AE
MTDERISDLDAAIRRLPWHSGIVFRHYGLNVKARRVLFNQVRRLARRYNHILFLADTPLQARQWGADGAHHRSALVSQGLRSAAVHNVEERIAAMRSGADLIFVSPAFETRSHPGHSALGASRLGLIAGTERTRTIALGGMTMNRANGLKALKLYGWAAIDAFSKP